MSEFKRICKFEKNQGSPQRSNKIARQGKPCHAAHAPRSWPPCRLRPLQADAHRRCDRTLPHRSAPCLRTALGMRAAERQPRRIKEAPQGTNEQDPREISLNEHKTAHGRKSKPFSNSALDRPHSCQLRIAAAGARNQCDPFQRPISAQLLHSAQL
jgi:hypothetical protein